MVVPNSGTVVFARKTVQDSDGDRLECLEESQAFDRSRSRTVAAHRDIWCIGIWEKYLVRDADVTSLSCITHLPGPEG